MKSLLGLSLGFPKWYIILPKLTNLFDTLEMGLLQNRYLVEGPMDPAHLINNMHFLLRKPWKFQFISFSGSKVIPFLLSDTRTDAHFASLDAQAIFFIYGKLYHSLYYVLLLRDLLTHSLLLGRKSFKSDDQKTI